MSKLGKKPKGFFLPDLFCYSISQMLDLICLMFWWVIQTIMNQVITPELDYKNQDATRSLQNNFAITF